MSPPVIKICFLVYPYKLLYEKLAQLLLRVLTKTYFKEIREGAQAHVALGMKVGRLFCLE